MKIHPQIITKNKLPEFVVLSYKEYEFLLEKAEETEDVEAIQDFHATTQEVLSFEILRSISNGESAVRVLREFRQLSQAALAKKAGVSRQFLCQIEKKERQGRTNTLKKIAQALEVDIELLLP